MNKIFGVLTKEIRGLHQAAYLLAGFAVLSSVLALFRERIFAHNFGAGIEMDLYQAAFRLPDIIMIVIASTVSLFVIIPFLSASETKQHAQSLVAVLFRVFGMVLVIISILVYFLTPFLTHALFSTLFERGFGDELIRLTRVLLMQPILLGLSGLFASVVQYHARYIITAIAPILYNLGIIIGVVFLYPIFGLIGLVYGVLLGAFLHVSIQAPFIIKNGYLKITRDIPWSVVGRIILISLPRTVAISSSHIALLFLSVMAGKMVEGSISVFMFAFNLQAAPLAIIGASYSVAAFPTLSKLFNGGDTDKFVTHIASAARHIIFWSLPVVALVVVLRAQIVRTILGTGQFDWTDTRLTAAALALFALSLVAQGLVLLFIRGYYAAGQTRVPLLVSIMSGFLTVILAYTLLSMYQVSEAFKLFIEVLLRVDFAQGTEVLMLPLAFALSSIITALVFLLLFTRDFPEFKSQIVHTFVQSLAATLALGTSAYVVLNMLVGIFGINTFVGIFMQGLVAGSAGILIWIVVLILFKNQEIRVVWKTLHTRFWKRPTISDIEV